MATTAHGTANAHLTFSPLVLCDSLLSLAQDAIMQDDGEWQIGC